MYVIPLMEFSAKQVNKQNKNFRLVIPEEKEFRDE